VKTSQPAVQNVKQPVSKSQKRIGCIEQLRSDVLAVMLDEELSGTADKLENEKQASMKVGQSTRPYEEEIAYVRREQQVRSMRRRAHSAYLDGIQREIAEQDAIERTLPNFDDRCNREFAEAWWRWGN
jgi:hypothetical protein